MARAHARAQTFREFSNSLVLGSGRGARQSRDELYEEMLAEKSPPARAR